MTAVQWALDQQHTLFALRELGGIDDYEYFNRSSKILEEAMEMEKEQMKRICFRSLEAHFDDLYYENFKIKWKQQ